MNRPLIAERFLQPEENLLMEIATLAKKTPNLIDLSIGDPDLITDATIIEAAFADVKAGHTKYTASDGSADFIQTVVDFYQKQYQLTFSPSQVRGTVGALHGMYLALAAIIDPGDEVIIHEPYFSPYKQQVELVGGVPVFIPTFEKDGFQIDVEVLNPPSLRKLGRSSSIHQTILPVLFFLQKLLKKSQQLPLTMTCWSSRMKSMKPFALMIPLYRWQPSHLRTPSHSAVSQKPLP